jgi:uncharacterized protein (TIGR00645 family)
MLERQIENALYLSRWVLALVDLALVASLVVMVMFSGYENFVSRLDINEARDKLSWLGKLGSGSLKLKVPRPSSPFPPFIYCGYL